MDFCLYGFAQNIYTSSLGHISTWDIVVCLAALSLMLMSHYSTRLDSVFIVRCVC